MILDALREWLERHDSGTRLPPERTLADTLATSRPALRKALAVLEAEGRILRQVGRGTFTTTPPTQDFVGLAALTARTSPHDAMMARLALEPELANLAALHATPLDIRQLQDLAARIRAVTT